MAEETQKTAASEVVVVVSDVPEPEKAPPQPIPVEEEKTATVEAEEKEKIGESASFKEETNVVGELPDPQKKALDELKQLVHEAFNKHEFTAPPPAKEEEKPAEQAKEEDKPTETKTEDKPAEAEPVAIETKEEEKSTPPAPEPVVVAAAIDEEGAKTVEAIEETIVAVATPPVEAPPAEEVSIWGIPLLADERSDVILLKFLRARDFKVKEAFAMLKSVVAWRKEFGIDSLIEEDLGCEQEKVVYMDGVDKQGHPVCYNAYGEYENKELYQNTFSDEEKRTKFLRWRIQFLEKSIRKLDFSPDGVCTIVQVNDLKNFPGLFKRELRQATNQAFQLFQDNYPEFVARQVVVNVPWWYLAFYRMISPFFTQRTKSKFVFAGPSKTAETLFKYIAPELVPVQYGGLSSEKEGEQEFTTADPVTEEAIKPATKHTIELPVSETCTLVWEVRVVGWDVCYGAEFVPSAEDGYTIIVQKSRKIGPTDEPVISSCFKIGEPGKVVLTFDNQTSKKKKLLFRSKTKPSE